MRVVATFHPPSSVVQSVKCRLNPADDLEYLVVAKTTRVEVFSLQPEGLRPECGADIWGRVVSLRAVPADDAGTANVLVMTDHPDPKLIVLGYAVESGSVSLTSKGHVSLHDRYGRQAEFVTDVFVDPSGQVAVASCYGGKLKVVQFENGMISNAFDVSLPEIFVLALSFLKTEPGTYALAILHYDHQQRLHLLARDLDIPNLELSPAPSPLLPTTVLPATTFPSLDPPPQLIPVPSLAVPDDNEDFTKTGHRGGVLVVGGRKVLFFEHTAPDRQDVKKGKQRRQGNRLSSANQAEVAKAKEKEKEREGRRVKPKASVKWPWSEVTAWCGVDEEGKRFLLGDAYGRLAMIAFDETPCLVLIPLGETSPPTSLTYLTSQVLYLGSHMGESQLLRIHPAPFADLDADTLPIPSGITTVAPSSLMASNKGKERGDVEMCEGRGLKDGKILSGKGTYVEVLESYQNIAPIMDAALADLDGSGQPQIVTCSGGRNSGALKVVRTGADFQELAVVAGLSNVTNVWPVRSRFSDTLDTHLVATTLEETYVFQFDAVDVIRRLDPSADGFVVSRPTLALSNIPKRVTTNNAGRMTSSYVDSSLVVQITPEKVNLVQYDAALGLFSSVGKWEPSMPGQGWIGRSIVAASVNNGQFILGLSGGRLVLLSLVEGSQFQVLKYQDFGDVSGLREISAISCAPFDRSKNFSTHIAVSFWGSNKVSILSLESAQSLLNTVCETSPLTSLPRSLLLYNFGSGRNKKEVDFQPHLLAGLADGTAVSFSLKNNELGDKKTFPLGTTPVALATCTVDGRPAVFASGSRAALLYWDRQRLHHSPVMLKDMVRGTSLNTSHFPSCLVLATPSALIIGGVRGVDKMQIRSIPMGLDSPRRITHHPTLKMFGVTSNRTTPPRVGDFEPTISSFKVLDDSTFDQIGQFICEPGEEITAVVALPERNGPRGTCFCIGTVHLEAADQEPSDGRLVVISVHNDGSSASGVPTITVVETQQVHGCVYQLVTVEGKIAAAVNTSVVLFELRFSEATHSYSLGKLTDWNHNYFVTSLVARGNTVVVGDAISSVSVLRVVGTQLQTIARDYGPLWPVAVEMMGDGAIIGANSDCNLFTFALQENETRAQHTLERDGSYHIDDVVNKFLPGGLTSAEMSEGQIIQSKQLFFTSSGRIGVILDMSDEISLHMTALQRNMAKLLDGLGDTNHMKWRAPVNSRGHSDAEPSFGFLDGDFLEQYLTFPHPEDLLQGENEAERITLPEAQIQAVLERLQSLH
ncbi:CPSF A subunit region-domain-containing protein [Amylocystis lapponica]|nr:CPSF A subunit region-domain-containing protein [Amylocystis lapponica]